MPCHIGKETYMRISEFEHFSTAMRPRLLTRAMAVVKNGDAAEDIVQETMLKLWTMRDDIDDYNSPEALALTIVHRLSLNYLRNIHVNVELCDDIMSDRNPSPEDNMIEGEGDLTAERLLAMLPHVQSMMIRMRHEDGLSNGEIARVLGMSDGAVRTALSRARRRIAEIYMKLQNNKRY